MPTNPLGELDATRRTVKRAQYEAMEFSLASDGVQVRNNSHANPESHEYLVKVADGVPATCTCPADDHYSGACKHRVAVAIRRPILDTVKQQQLVADGGIDTQAATSDSDKSEDEAEAEENEDRDCDCAYLSDDFPCWECFHSGRRDLPND